MYWNTALYHFHGKKFPIWTENTAPWHHSHGTNSPNCQKTQSYIISMEKVPIWTENTAPWHHSLKKFGPNGQKTQPYIISMEKVPIWTENTVPWHHYHGKIGPNCLKTQSYVIISMEKSPHRDRKHIIPMVKLAQMYWKHPSLTSYPWWRRWWRRRRLWGPCSSTSPWGRTRGAAPAHTVWSEQI